MKHVLCMFIFSATIVSSIAAVADPSSPTFTLRFTIWSAKDSGIKLPDSRKSLNGNEFTHIKGEADYTILSKSKLKLRFIKPIAFEIKKNGAAITVPISSITVKSDSKEIEGLRHLLNAPSTEVYTFTDSHKISIDRIIEAGTTKESILPILQEGIIPELLKFNGTIFLNGEFFISQIIERKDLEGGLTASLNDIEEYDHEAHTIYIKGGQASTLAVSNLAANSNPRMKIYDLRNDETINLLNGIINLKQLRENILGGITSFTDADGQKMVGFIPPKGNSNIVRAPFGKGKCEDLMRPKNDD